ncbi:MAG TPA: hypothetical protein VHA80_09220 [Solirubrobacterales bacterium]|nr:hypothetical protein [Solirubrobacterales bacterium]
MGRRRDPHRREPLDLEITRDLVEEVLRTALILEDVIVSLLEDLPDGAFPGEDNGLALLEMIVGSVHPATVAAGARDTRAATALVVAIRERVLADLRTAAVLARERERDESGGAG